MSFDIQPYDLCPCGSGEKYKFCCKAKAKGQTHGKYPIGTVAYYGPDDKTATKIAAGVVRREMADPIMERWMAQDIKNDAKVADEIKRFFAMHGVKNVVITDGILGCPHEEGIDFPMGADCPACPFWAGKQGTSRRNEADDERLDEDDEANDDEGENGDAMSGAEDSGAADEDDDEEDHDALFARVIAILGEGELDAEQTKERLLGHLKANLQLPCEVTGIEDFQWEERYVIGGWDPREYKKLKKTQPSYTDKFQLLALDGEMYSEWMMFLDEDIAAHVRRTSDNKEFILGLSELEATDKKSANYQLLRDYAVWLVNNR